MEEYYTNNKNYKIGRKCPITSATIYGLGLIKKGFDNNLWKVVSNIDGHKYWTKFSHKKQLSRLTSNLDNHTSNDNCNINLMKRSEFTDLINKSNYSVKYTLTNLKYVISDLIKLGYMSDLIPLTPIILNDNPTYYINHINDYMNDWNNYEWKNNKYIIFYVYLNNSSSAIIENYKIGTIFTFISFNEKKVLIDLLNKRLPNQCEWTTNNNDKIIIDYNVYDLSSIGYEKYYQLLSLNVKYPILAISITFNKNIIDIENIINNLTKNLTKIEISKSKYEFDKSNIEVIVQEFQLTRYYDVKETIVKYIKTLDTKKYTIDYFY
jgi:hypothetical protein